MRILSPRVLSSSAYAVKFVVASVVLALLEFTRVFFFFQAEDGIRDLIVTGVQTCALPISSRRRHTRSDRDWSSDVCSSDLRAPSELQSRSDLVCRLLLVTGVQTVLLDRKSVV